MKQDMSAIVTNCFSFKFSVRKLLLILTAFFLVATVYFTIFYLICRNMKREHFKAYLIWVDRNGTRDSIGYNNPYCTTFHRKQTERGPGQLVVSYTFYGSLDNSRNYFKGIVKNVKLVKEYYPGWIMRVYHATPNTAKHYSTMEELEKKYENLDFCNILNVTSLGDVAATFGMLWRFIPMADPMVDIFLSRDLDSVIYPREVAAVQEWLDTNYTFHIMRDHPLHTASIMGGMWGARMVNRRSLLSNLTQMIFKNGRDAYYGADQNVLGRIIWPYTDGDGIHHDSYHCTKSSLKHNFWRPFPRRRESNEFVGSSGGVIPKECPLQCRANPEWTFC